MSPWVPVIVSITGLLIVVFFNVAGYLIQYGALKARIDGLKESNAGLAKRIDSLEHEMGQLGDLKTSVGKIETAQHFIIEQLKDLNASLRWATKVADAGDAPPSKPSRPRRSRSST